MKIWMQGAFVVAVAIFCGGATAQAQTDVALSGYRTFASSTTGSGTKQTPTDSEGGLFEWRHIANPLVGFEFEVTFNPANQSYIATNATPPTCYPTGTTGPPLAHSSRFRARQRNSEGPGSSQRRSEM